MRGVAISTAANGDIIYSIRGSRGRGAYGRAFDGGSINRHSHLLCVGLYDLGKHLFGQLLTGLGRLVARRER